MRHASMSYSAVEPGQLVSPAAARRTLASLPLGRVSAPIFVLKSPIWLWDNSSRIRLKSTDLQAFVC
jgi:hypothetical protein